MNHKVGLNLLPPILAPVFKKAPVSAEKALETPPPQQDGDAFIQANVPAVATPLSDPVTQIAVPVETTESPPAPNQSPPNQALVPIPRGGTLDFGLGGIGSHLLSDSHSDASFQATESLSPGCLDKPIADAPPFHSMANANYVYLTKLAPVEERYPGVVARLKQAEECANVAGYTPTRAQAVIEEMQKNPPWPAGSYPNNMERIAAKAQELGELHEEFPELSLMARAKAPGSLANKLQKLQKLDPRFSLAHLTDTVGARLDCQDLTTLGKVAHKIEQMYRDKIVAKSDYLSEPGVNGYRALHYTVDLGDRMAEIQMTTVLLRATDLATHDTLYKPQIPLEEADAAMLSTAADRAMFHECVKTILARLHESGSVEEQFLIAGHSPGSGS